MRSADRIRIRRAGLMRPTAVAACVCLLGAGATGCSTTQEKAQHQKARAEHILKARAERKQAKKEQDKGAKRNHHHKGTGK